jgi:hypothetical protein
MEHGEVGENRPVTAGGAIDSRRTPRIVVTDAHARERKGVVALAVFIVAVALAAVVIFVAGRHQWFYLDEWDFLARRTAGNLGDLFRPHNEHWSTLPILEYRLLWQLVGLRSYRPYQVVVIALHLATAILLRAVMRRSGVDPWIATAAATLFLFLGSGDQDIIWAFQSGYVGAVVFGLCQLLVAAHEGPIGARDWLALGFGLLALMCSGVAVPMVLAVGVAVLIARGWRPALLQTGPLAGIYLAWLFAIGRSGYGSHGTTVHDVVSFTRSDTTVTFRGLGHSVGIAIILGVLLTAGTALGAFVGARRDRWQLAMPIGLLVGALAYVLSGAIGRPNFTFNHETNRYIHVTAALTLPALAYGADAIVRRWRIAFPAVLAVLVVGIPGNIREFRVHNFVDQGSPAFTLTLPRVPLAHRVPRDTRPDLVLAPDVTIGWLLSGVASGRIPSPPDHLGAESTSATLSLALAQTNASTTPNPCRAVRGATPVEIAEGERVGLAGGPLEVALQPTLNDGYLTYSPAGGNQLTARTAIATWVRSADPSHPATLCRVAD